MESEESSKISSKLSNILEAIDNFEKQSKLNLKLGKNLSKLMFDKNEIVVKAAKQSLDKILETSNSVSNKQFKQGIH